MKLDLFVFIPLILNKHILYLHIHVYDKRQSLCRVFPVSRILFQASELWCNNRNKLL